MTDRTVHVALVQHPPRVLDAAETLRRGAQHVADAAARGAELVVFPESWVSGYPAWVFGAAGWDDPLAREIHARFLADAIVLGGEGDLDDGLAPLRAAAAAHAVTVVVGINERSSATGVRSTTRSSRSRRTARSSTCIASSHRPTRNGSPGERATGPG